MQLARITSRFDDLPDLYIFECSACDVSHIEPALVGLDATVDHQVAQKSSGILTLLGRLDAIEGNRLFGNFENTCGKPFTSNGGLSFVPR